MGSSRGIQRGRSQDGNNSDRKPRADVCPGESGPGSGKVPSHLSHQRLFLKTDFPELHSQHPERRGETERGAGGDAGSGSGGTRGPGPEETEQGAGALGAQAPRRRAGSGGALGAQALRRPSGEPAGTGTLGQGVGALGAQAPSLPGTTAKCPPSRPQCSGLRVQALSPFIFKGHLFGRARSQLWRVNSSSDCSLTRD